MHFYTLNTDELNNATGNLGWTVEGVEFCAYPTSRAEIPELIMLERLEHEASGDFLYTFAGEVPSAVSAGYRYNGVAGWVFPAELDPNKYGGLTVPLYRLYNPSGGSVGDHFYCTSEQERDAAVSNGYGVESIICRVFKNPPPAPIPSASFMFRAYREQIGFWSDVWSTIKGPIKDVLLGLILIAAAKWLLFSGSAKEDKKTNTITGNLVDADSPFAETGWRWCNKCQALTYGGEGYNGVCPAGGDHDHAGSGNYIVLHDAPFNSGQSNWRWCDKCQALVYGEVGGVCPAGGEHNHTNWNYMLVYNAPNCWQSNWRWCNKCQTLVFGDRGGVCPAGGEHAHESWNYALALE
jgi:RNA polymerase subunit RPABC4/transcription elongation factor Spt4